MKKLIFVVFVLFSFIGASCFGTYARKTGEVENDMNSKYCIYDAGGKHFWLLWAKYTQCPYSVEINMRTGDVCKVN